jgi:hypothetical protein
VGSRDAASLSKSSQCLSAAMALSFPSSSVLFQTMFGLW